MYFSGGPDNALLTYWLSLRE